MPTAGKAYEALACPRCRKPLIHDQIMSGRRRCPSCNGEFEAVKFSPPARHVEVERLSGGSQATCSSCANHLSIASVVYCERCGVFMCSLCRIDVDELELCPACFDRLSAEGALPSTRMRYRDYGRQASSYAVLGVLFWIIGPVLGPVAAYYGFRSLRQLREMGEPGGRLGAWVAILAGALEAAGGTWFWAAVFMEAI